MSNYFVKKLQSVGEIFLVHKKGALGKEMIQCMLLVYNGLVYCMFVCMYLFVYGGGGG